MISTIGCANTIIPSSVTKIDRFSFYSCDSMSEFTVPSTVEDVCEYAFWECENLKTVTFEASENTMQPKTCPFYECNSLETIYVPSKKLGYYKKCLDEDLHDKLVELKPVKK